MGPRRIGERVKVMRCPSTGTYVMYMHSDDLHYMDPHICVATSDTIDGEYTFAGELTYHGDPIRKWDMGTFQDDDGTGYLLLHEGDIYRLVRTFWSPRNVWYRASPGVGSRRRCCGTTARISSCSRTRRAGRATRTSPVRTVPRRPWTYRGHFAPDGSLTCNSRCLCVHHSDRRGRCPPVHGRPLVVPAPGLRGDIHLAPAARRGRRTVDPGLLGRVGSADLSAGRTHGEGDGDRLLLGHPGRRDRGPLHGNPDRPGGPVPP